MAKRSLHVTILSREPRSYSTLRLKEACALRGHKVRILDTLNLSIGVEHGSPELYYKGKSYPSVDVVIPRIGASITFYGTAVVRQFEQMGVFTLNGSHAISVSRDKLRSLQVLSRHDIGIPPSEFVKSREDVLPAIDRLGGAPVIIKLLEGTQGVGVILAETRRVAQAIVETLQFARQNVLIQKFVKESAGRDVRAIVIGGRVVAAMRRTAAGGEFRSNVHRGATTEPVTLDSAYERTAIHAAQIMGLRMAGVDMLESDSGPQVMEVNSSPGLQGIEQATGIDVASVAVDLFEEEIFFPHVDLRQRLTLERGYGVAEFTITPNSPLAGKSLGQLALREIDVNVLSIHRGDLVLPNPKGDTDLMVGDQILAYGKQLALKALIPDDGWPRRRKKRGGRKTGLPTLLDGGEPAAERPAEGIEPAPEGRGDDG